VYICRGNPLVVSLGYMYNLLKGNHQGYLYEGYIIESKIRRVARTDRV